MQKNSAYTKYFNHVLKDIRQNGQLDILKKRYTIAPKTYCKNLPKTNLALGYEKLTFLFVILIIGTVLSFFIFMLEFKMKYEKKKELGYFSEEIDDYQIKKSMSIQQKNKNSIDVDPNYNFRLKMCPTSVKKVLDVLSLMLWVLQKV